MRHGFGRAFFIWSVGFWLRPALEPIHPSVQVLAFTLTCIRYFARLSCEALIRNLLRFPCSVSLPRRTMELLLNLFWLTLTLPAIWMWRREPVCAKDCGRFERIRPFLLFGCLLLLLFPVVSATDDLHAMRQVMEESSASKRMVKQGTGDKSYAALSHSDALLALVLLLVSFRLNHEACGRVSMANVVLPQPPHCNETASRAPPFSPLGEGVAFAA